MALTRDLRCFVKEEWVRVWRPVGEGKRKAGAEGGAGVKEHMWRKALTGSSGEPGMEETGIWSVRWEN